MKVACRFGGPAGIYDLDVEELTFWADVADELAKGKG